MLFLFSYVDGCLVRHYPHAHPKSPLKCVNRIHSLKQDGRSVSNCEFCLHISKESEDQKCCISNVDLIKEV
jgi:hypothetical protein